MTNKKSVSTPNGQSNLFDLFGRNANKSMVEVEARPSRPQIQEQPAPINKPAPPVLPEGWAVEDIRFLLGILESAPILVADTKLGIPTIHDDFGAEVQHCGFGVMKVAGQGYELIFDAGGAMERTPTGKGWTRLDIRKGKYPYDSQAVREKLEAFLPKDDPSQTADPSPALPADDAAKSEQSDRQPVDGASEDKRVTLAEEVKEMMVQLDTSGSADLSTLNVFRQKVWSITRGINELESQVVSKVGDERDKVKEALANMEAVLGNLTVSCEWMRCILLKLLLPENLRPLIKVEVSGPDTLMFFGNGYGLKLELQLTAAGELELETVKAVVIQAQDDIGYTHCEDAPVKDCATTVKKLPEICQQLMKQTSPKIPVEEQTKEFNHDLGTFTGTEKWTRYLGLCPHIILLTDGALYVAEHGGEDGNSAFWLIDAIASYQGEDALKHHTFQVWKLCILPPDPEEPDVPPMSVGAVLKSKQGDSPAQPRNPCRHAVLTCTNGNEKELVRQEIDYTDFLPVGELTLYASVEEHPDVSTTRKVMIILLPSED